MKENKELLERVYKYLYPRITTDLLHRSSAMALREVADFEERKERDLAEFRKLIDSL